jgi:hypothetical protein
MKEVVSATIIPIPRDDGKINNYTIEARCEDGLLGFR